MWRTVSTVVFSACSVHLLTVNRNIQCVHSEIYLEFKVQYNYVLCKAIYV